MESGRLSPNGETSKRVRLLLEDGTPYPQEGALQFRDVTVDPTTGSFTLRIVVPNQRNLLLPGMFLRAVVQEGVMEQAILAPQQGIIRTPKGEPVAWVVDESGKVQQRPLVLNRTIGNAWLVSSGLSAGDRVIVEGTLNVRPGMVVKAVPLSATKEAAAAQPSAN